MFNQYFQPDAEQHDAPDDFDAVLEEVADGISDFDPENSHGGGYGADYQSRFDDVYIEHGEGYAGSVPG